MPTRPCQWAPRRASTEANLPTPQCHGVTASGEQGPGLHLPPPPPFPPSVTVTVTAHCHDSPGRVLLGRGAGPGGAREGEGGILVTNLRFSSYMVGTLTWTKRDTDNVSHCESVNKLEEVRHGASAQ